MALQPGDAGLALKNPPLHTTDDQHIAQLRQLAALDPDAYFTLGGFLRSKGRVDEAAVADRQGFDKGLDQVAMSTWIQPLVNYYYDHGRKADAEMVAKRAAEVYSQDGLGTYYHLLEKLGRLDEAAEIAQDMADRYGDTVELELLYLRHVDHFKAQVAALQAKVFPKGLQAVTLSSFQGAPAAGAQFVDSDNDLATMGLRMSEVVVAVNGHRADNIAQYFYLTQTAPTPALTLIVWRDGQYFKTQVFAPDHQVGDMVQNYSPPSL